ncbi:MAG: hypothetical protein AUH85_10550 [Chloroflexi bacterium 13_1_40CM_4_68_4]|nr:MAG: hypothetical protein AUH85_10550 [Chloroflexi bacterium 13_1_40CM_4_68_4]
MALAARDKKTLLTLIEQAQLVYLLSRYPKKQVLDDVGDAAKLEAGLEGMRLAAKELPARIKSDHALIPWDELAQKPDSPTVIREMAPMLAGEPEAAFFLRPEAPKERTARKTAKKQEPRKLVTAKARSAKRR